MSAPESIISNPIIRWSVNPCSWTDAARLSHELSIPHTAAMVLAGRGLVEPLAARRFIDCSEPLPDPFLFADMPAAVEKIIAAVEKQQKIVVHGDYDADGITATAVMVTELRRLGGRVEWYLPSRFKEGYGLSRTAVEAIAAESAKLLITVDCGVNYPDEVALALELGLDVIVVDHHEPGPRLPDCCLIHHTRGDYPHGDLCGVGLALKVLHAVHILKSGADRQELPEEISPLLDLVAIGTVADLSPLLGENRYYVREGLRLLNLGLRVGTRALCEVASCMGSVDSGAIAFRIGPRLNAAGRLADPSPPLRLLLTEDESEARKLAEELHELNGARQDLERSMFDDARRRVESLEALPTVVVLADPEWHEGVVGIVASRLVEEFHRPTVLLRIREGVAKGSGRSIAAYDLLSGITECASLLTVFGGHAQAAGLTLEATNIDAFREALEAHASSVLSDADLMPRYKADAVLSAEDLGEDTARALAKMEPFGCGNSRPRLLVVDARLRRLQPTKNGLHVRGVADVGGVSVPFVGFGMGSSLVESTNTETLCVAGAQLKADEWRGTIRTQLILEKVADLQDAEPDAPLLGKNTTQTLHHEEDLASDERGLDPCSAGSSCAGGSIEWPPSSRDRRGRPGRFTDLAQILATRQRTVILVGSWAATISTLLDHLPSFLIDTIEMRSSARAVLEEHGDGFGDIRVKLVEWASLCGQVGVLHSAAHVVVFDPPYRPEHVQAVSALADGGTLVHLLYGEQERKGISSLLRYTVHPRFAMVCVYRSMENAYKDVEELLSAASRAAWQEARVTLTRQDLGRALEILEELGVQPPLDGKAKLDVQSSAKYRQAEAYYEECLRSCLTL